MDRFWFESAVFDGKINYQVQITVESEVIREITVGVEKPLDVLHFDAMAMPGFIDTHCHGGGGYFFSDQDPNNIESIAKFHLANGTTTLFASLVSEDAVTLESQVKRLGSLLPLSTIAPSTNLPFNSSLLLYVRGITPSFFLGVLVGCTVLVVLVVVL